MASEEQRFYYLRLMAKPNDEGEPIKPKFVQWGSTREFNTSIDENPDLEVVVARSLLFGAPSVAKIFCFPYQAVPLCWIYVSISR